MSMRQPRTRNPNRTRRPGSLALRRRSPQRIAPLRPFGERKVRVRPHTPSRIRRTPPATAAVRRPHRRLRDRRLRDRRLRDRRLRDRRLRDGRRPLRGWYPLPHWFALPNLPTNIEPSALPPWLDTPGLRRYERSALASLWRRDMLAGGWVQRLQRAPSQLVNFINDFYTLPGFHHLVRHAYGGTYRRALALLAIRVVERLAGRDPDLPRRATIEETLSVLPTGDLLLAPELVHNGLRFRFFPWNRVTDRALLRLLQQSAALHPQPANLRWVFAGNSARRREIIRSMRRILDRSPARWRDNPDMRRWVNDLDRIIRVA